MSHDLETYLQDPGPQNNGDYTGLLRQAMDEVLRLSAATVEPLESQIESEYQQARRGAQERFDRDKDRIERELRLKSREIQQQYETRVQEAESEYESRLSALKVEIQQKRKRVMQSATDLETKAEKEKQDQLLVAEFVAEGAATRRQQRSFEAKANAEEMRRQLDDLDAQAAELIRQYRCRDLTPGDRTGPGTDNDQSPAETLRSQRALAEQHLARLRKLHLAQLFVGARPVLLAGGLLGAAATLLAVLHLLKISITPAAPIVLVSVFILIVVGGRILWRRGQSQVRRIYGEFQASLMSARMALGQQSALTLDQIEQEWQASVEQKQAELKRAQTTLETAKANIAKQRGTSLHQVEDQRQESLNSLKATRDQAVHEAQQKQQQQQAEVESRFQKDLAETQRRYDEETAACQSKYQAARKSLEDRWDKGLTRIDALLRNAAGLDGRAAGDWEHLLGQSWTPSQTPPAGARFAAINVDLGCLAGSVAARAGSMLDARRVATVPAMLEFPDHCSLLLEYPREGRQEAIDTLRRS